MLLLWKCFGKGLSKVAAGAVPPFGCTMPRRLQCRYIRDRSHQSSVFLSKLGIEARGRELACKDALFGSKRRQLRSFSSASSLGVASGVSVEETSNYIFSNVPFSVLEECLDWREGSGSQCAVSSLWEKCVVGAQSADQKKAVGLVELRDVLELKHLQLILQV